MISKYISSKKQCLFCIVFLLFGTIGCKKLVEVNSPDNRIESGNVYTSDATAIAVLTNLYSKLSATNYTGTASIPTISFSAGLSADEFTLWSGATANQLAYYRNALAVNIAGEEFWRNIYPLIYPCNAAIEGLNSSVTLSPAVKKQLLGEAKFLRAFFYFYLVNFYGDVPLALSTDYTINSLLTRSTKDQVYQQIISDLRDAQNELVDGYVKVDGITLYPVSSAEKVRPNKAAATALLARVYLYTGDYIHAEEQASLVISNSTYYNLASLNNVFLKNSVEAIWQLQPVTIGVITNTAEAVFFDLNLAPVGVNATHPVSLSSSLISSFEVNDQRAINGNWVKSYTTTSAPITTFYYPYKYKISASGAAVTEYTMMLRLGEQFLIRSEARTQQGNISGAQSDLNAIRTRAGLPNTTASTQSALIAAILHERQIELFAEIGQRWLDLKRTGNVEAVMSVQTPLKGGTWNTNWQLYPIPLTEIQKEIYRNTIALPIFDYLCPRWYSFRTRPFMESDTGKSKKGE